MHQQAISGREGPNVFPAEVPTPVFKLKIRRTHLLEDTFRQLGATDHENFQKQLVVSTFCLWINWFSLCFLGMTRTVKALSLIFIVILHFVFTAFVVGVQ